MEAHSLARDSGGLTVPRSRRLLAAFGDDRLVDQLRRGNETAFEVLYDRHHAGVLSYCRHMLGSRDEAEDALQQAFVSAHADIMSSDKEIRFKAWIYTIARNRCLSLLRARRERPSAELERVSTAGLSEEVEQRADLKQLLHDMHELPEEQRAALVLSELGDLSHSEIGEAIGCEAQKVKSLVFQARSGLIERRQARETPCAEIREQLATLRGGSLRRGPLRRHLKACPGCRDFREEVRRQRQMVAAVLPVIPTIGLKESALAAAGVGTGSAVGGGLLAGGGAALTAKAGFAKVAVIAAATGGAIGGAVAVEEQIAGGGGGGGGSETAAPADSVRERGGATTGVLERSVKHRGALTGDARARGPASADGGRSDANGKKGGRDKQAAAGERSRDTEPARGFEPVRGESNGEGARDFARGRGKGRKRGLEKQKAHDGANRGAGRGRPAPKTAPKPAPPGREGQRPGRKPESRPEQSSPIGPLLTPPELTPQATAPRVKKLKNEREPAPRPAER